MALNPPTSAAAIMLRRQGYKARIRNPHFCSLKLKRSFNPQRFPPGRGQINRIRVHIGRDTGGLPPPTNPPSSWLSSAPKIHFNLVSGGALAGSAHPHSRTGKLKGETKREPCWTDASCKRGKKTDFLLKRIPDMQGNLLIGRKLRHQYKEKLL